MIHFSQISKEEFLAEYWQKKTLAHKASDTEFYLSFISR